MCYTVTQKGAIMEKTVITFLGLAFLLLFSACANSNPTPADEIVADIDGTNAATDTEYTVYPTGAADYITDIGSIEEPPESIFSTLSEESGGDTMYKFCGQVTAVEAASLQNQNCDTITVKTDKGEVAIISTLHLLAEQASSINPDKSAQLFALPHEGEMVCVYAVYAGFSETLQKPTAIYGGTDLIVAAVAAFTEESPEQPVQDANAPDFFDDLSRQEKYTELYTSYQYKALYDYVQDYLSSNDAAATDSAQEIISLIEPLLPYENKWVVTYDEFDNRYTAAFSGAQELSESCAVVPTVKGTGTEIKLGFVKQGWLFFDQYEIRADGEYIKSGSVKFDTVCDVLSGHMIREYAQIGISDDKIDQMHNADKVIVRFSNEKSQETLDHNFTQDELDALYCAIHLRMNNRDLSNLLYHYRQAHEND